MRRNIRKTTPNLVGRKKRDSNSNTVSPAGTPRAAAAAVVATPELSVQAASDEGSQPQAPAQAGDGTLSSELDELLSGVDVESPPTGLSPPQSATSSGLTPMQMEFARASFLSETLSSDTEYHTPTYSVSHVPGEALNQLPSPVRPQPTAEGGDPGLDADLDKSIELNSTQSSTQRDSTPFIAPRALSSELPSPVGPRSIQHSETSEGTSLEQPLLLSPLRDSSNVADTDVTDSVAFCISPFIACFDVSCTIGAVVVGLVQRVDRVRLHVSARESLVWLVLVLALACLFLLPVVLGWLGRRSQRHRWMLSCSATCSIFLAVLAMAGSAAVLTYPKAAANRLDGAFELHPTSEGGSSSDSEGASRRFQRHVVFAGSLLCISGVMWLVRGVIGCIILRHLQRADSRAAARAACTEPKTTANVGGYQGQALAMGADAASSTFGRRQHSDRELRSFIS